MATAAHPPASPAAPGRTPRVSVVLPCLDEAATIAACVTTALGVLREAAIDGEVVVADNGSTDGSAELAAQAGARVVREPRRGYGAALLAGFGAARGTYLVMADADLTYDLADLPRFVAELDAGADLVMGDRMDGIDAGAMPLLHRYVGNPLLSGVLNAFFRTGVRDAHCGLRALRRDVLPRLDLRTTGMEFASEMVIRAAKARLDIRQLPIRYRVRAGAPSKLSSFRDGWRHLRFLLVHSPTHLFFVPGTVLVVLGALAALTVLARLEVLGRQWDLHALIGGCLVVIVGVQVLGLGLCARAFGVHVLGEEDAWLGRMRRRFRLEHGLLLGGGLLLAGLVLCGVIVATWLDRGFGELREARLAVVAATLVIVGLQVFFSSFLLSILGLRRAR